MQGQPSRDQVIPLASRVDIVPIADNVVLEVWVSVESRRKAGKQSCCNPKGKEVIIVEPMSVVNTCETPSPPQYVQERCDTPLLPELNYWWLILVLERFRELTYW